MSCRLFLVTYHANVHITRFSGREHPILAGPLRGFKGIIISREIQKIEGAILAVRIVSVIGFETGHFLLRKLPYWVESLGCKGLGFSVRA